MQYQLLISNQCLSFDTESMNSESISKMNEILYEIFEDKV